MKIERHERRSFRADHTLTAVAAAIVGTALGSLALPAAAVAQEADFLFQQPKVTVGVRLGYALPRAGSEIFDFTREQLTVEKSDFNAFTFGGDVAVRVTERIDVAANIGYERSDTRSEFREFIGTDDLPIEQNTRFTRVPVTAGIKVYLLDRARRVSRYAWIPRRWAPYLGAGAGYVWYEFEQEGEFVDFETLDIFFHDFRSDGGSPLAYAAAGIDLSMGPRWLVTAEVRHAWASAEMGRDFVGFDDIDLSGFRGTLGISLRI